jgi:N6-adenosine-specific RNA methylase IME4
VERGQDPLASLAEQINVEHEACVGGLRESVQHALAAGRLLIEAKDKVAHGQWLPWLKENCRCSTRTAQAYMRVARQWPELEAKAQGLAHLTFEDALGLLAQPAREDSTEEGAGDQQEGAEPGRPARVDYFDESKAVYAWLEKRRQRWPEDMRHAFAVMLCTHAHHMQNGDDVDRQFEDGTVDLPRLPPDGCTVDDLQALIDRGERFGTIYADPPWKYGNGATRGAAARHYPAMDFEETRALPVPQLAAVQSHLHLWVTKDFLRHGLELLDAWGFEYKGQFVWVKPAIGTGNYWRVAHELMLLGVRGSLTFQGGGERSWQEYDRGEHSAKPEDVRQRIERVSPGPRLELFGRRAAPGWVVWGNAIERDLFHQSIPHLAAEAMQAAGT